METETAEYCIILREGENAREEQYFPIPKEKLEEIFEGYELTVKGKCYAGLAHIAGNDTKHGEEEDILEIDKKKGLLEFNCKNEETANKCVEYWKLGKPF